MNKVIIRTREDDDIVYERMAFCGHPLANIGVIPSCFTEPPKIRNDNSFRGGSRGKGGKTKYTRK